jgi:hypothetical protein
MNSCLYFGRVVHRRLKPRPHALDYRVFSLFADLDELDRLHRRLRLFSRNRFNLFGFSDADHGTAAAGLRSWVERQLTAAGIGEAGAIRVLCYPRILGYVFNPLSVFFCHRPHGGLAAILYEVHNTFGQRHGYLIPVADGAAPVIRQSCEKRFYVSPFIAMEGEYSFRIVPPDETVAIAITQSDATGPLLHASFVGRRRDLTDTRLGEAFVRYPLMTAKVIGGIHWEAFRLWRKGIPLVDRPPPPEDAVTIVAAGRGEAVLR